MGLFMSSSKWKCIANIKTFSYAQHIKHAHACTDTLHHQKIMQKGDNIDIFFPKSNNRSFTAVDVVKQKLVVSTGAFSFTDLQEHTLRE